MAKKYITDYISQDTLSVFGFNAGETSLVWKKGHRNNSVYGGYHEQTNTQILIGSSSFDDYTKRREWFLKTIPNMSPEDMQGERHEDWLDYATGFLVRKNRIAGSDLSRKLHELAA